LTAILPRLAHDRRALAHTLWRLDAARRKLALWRYDYNAVRPHSSLGNQTPLEARRTLEQFEASAPGALAQNDRPNYQSQTRGLLL